METNIDNNALERRADGTERLREIIRNEIENAGWSFDGEKYIAPQYVSKDDLRQFHKSRRVEWSAKELAIVERYGGKLLQEFANGSEINPGCFSPILCKVASDTWDSYVFRFATLWWSIPVSRGYGRRMRYLVRDSYNGKVVGIIALGDPVFNLKARDDDIGWDQQGRRQRLYNVMDAFGIGAAPPYNQLLCGKFIAMAAVSNEVRNDFTQKYEGRVTIIQKRMKEPALVLVTTTSAMGRSSIYNRLTLLDEKDPVYRRVGFSSGYGHFQFSERTFKEIRNYLRSQNDPYADGHIYGDGPSWRLRTIRKALDLLGFDEDLLRHGVQREVFVVPLARNYREYLKGEQTIPDYYDRPIKTISDYFKGRWMVQRSQRISEWRSWTREDMWRQVMKNCGRTVDVETS